MNRVFVYGTLKKGEPNHGLLSDPRNGYSNFLGHSKTKDRFALVIGTKFNIPFMLDGPNPVSHQIVGEVYEVDENMLAQLDILEEHPRVYERKIISVTVCDKEIQAWAYFLVNFNKDLLALPHISNYSTNDSHGLQYVSSHITLKDVPELW